MHMRSLRSLLVLVVTVLVQQPQFAEQQLMLASCIWQTQTLAFSWAVRVHMNIERRWQVSKYKCYFWAHFEKQCMVWVYITIENCKFSMLVQRTAFLGIIFAFRSYFHIFILFFNTGLFFLEGSLCSVKKITNVTVLLFFLITNGTIMV